VQKLELEVGSCFVTVSPGELVKTQGAKDKKPKNHYRVLPNCGFSFLSEETFGIQGV
jgi:hypothetical protein